MYEKHNAFKLIDSEFINQGLNVCIYIYIFDQGEIKCVVLEKKKKKTLFNIHIHYS